MFWCSSSRPRAQALLVKEPKPFFLRFTHRLAKDYAKNWSNAKESNMAILVVVYFEILSRNKSKSIPIKAYRTHSVVNQKPSSVILYNYYDTNKQATEFYIFDSKLAEICE